MQYDACPTSSGSTVGLLEEESCLHTISGVETWLEFDFEFSADFEHLLVLYSLQLEFILS